MYAGQRDACRVWPRRSFSSAIISPHAWWTLPGSGCGPTVLTERVCAMPLRCAHGSEWTKRSTSTVWETAVGGPGGRRECRRPCQGSREGRASDASCLRQSGSLWPPGDPAVGERKRMPVGHGYVRVRRHRPAPAIDAARLVDLALVRRRVLAEKKTAGYMGSGRRIDLIGDAGHRSRSLSYAKRALYRVSYVPVCFAPDSSALDPLVCCSIRGVDGRVPTR
jgi:hypothetical protein